MNTECPEPWLFITVMELISKDQCKMYFRKLFKASDLTVVAGWKAVHFGVAFPHHDLLPLRTVLVEGMFRRHGLKVSLEMLWVGQLNK